MYDNVKDALRESVKSGPVEFLLFPDEIATLILDTENIEGEKLEQAIAIAQQTVLALQNKREFLLDAIADEFLKEYNEICHPDKPESKEQFLDKIYLDMVIIGVETATVFIYYIPKDLDNFFGDHAIAVMLSSDLQVEFVEMVG